MKRIITLITVITVIGFTSCTTSEDDNDVNTAGDENCLSCKAYALAGNIEFASVDICEGENGNAIVAGEDTGEKYDDRLAALRLLTSCD